MQYPTFKRFLRRQNSSASRMRTLKNQDRVLYVRGLFNPPREHDPLSETEKKEKEQWRSLFSIGLLAGFGIVMLLISLVGDYGVLATHALKQRELRLLGQQAEQQEQQTLLLEEIHALRTSPAYIEVVARKELGPVHANELIYHLPESLQVKPHALNPSPETP